MNKILKNPFTNKSNAFTRKERSKLHLNILLPNSVETIEYQTKRFNYQYSKLNTDIDRYLFLNNIYENNIVLFYYIVHKNIFKYLEIIYDPTIAYACLEYSYSYLNPQGLYMCINDTKVYSELKYNLNKDLKFVCITSGERILGLGDIGINGTPIPIGKLQIYTILAGIPPQYSQPIFFDFGTNNTKLLNDPLYLGLKQKRPGADTVDKHVDKFMKTLYTLYPNVCVHFEDWKGIDAMRLLKKYKNKYCCFNDDIQGTGSVTLSGLISAVKIKHNSISFKNEKILFLGAGSAGLGISNIILDFLVKYENITYENAKKQILLIDSKGLIYKGRDAEINIYKKELQYEPSDLIQFKKQFPTKKNSEKNIINSIKLFKPTMIIGVSTKGGLFTKNVIKEMYEINERPIIFALSNPTANAECTAEDAYKYTNGRALFAAGVQFNPVTLNNKTHYPGQANNFYIYPSVALTKYISNCKIIYDTLFIEAAIALSNTLTKKDIENELLYPHQNKMFDITQFMCKHLCDYLIKNKLINLNANEINTNMKKNIYKFTYNTNLNKNNKTKKRYYS